MEKEEKRTISIQVSESIYEILAERARKNMGSISREIRVLISQSLVKESEEQLNDEKNN